MRILPYFTVLLAAALCHASQAKDDAEGQGHGRHLGAGPSSFSRDSGSKSEYSSLQPVDEEPEVSGSGDTGTAPAATAGDAMQVLQVAQPPRPARTKGPADTLRQAAHSVSRSICCGDDQEPNGLQPDDEDSPRYKWEEASRNSHSTLESPSPPHGAVHHQTEVMFFRHGESRVSSKRRHLLFFRL